MLQLSNETPFAASRAVMLDARGAEVWVVIIKATFRVSAGRVALAPEQEPVHAEAVYAGEPGASSLLRETEMVAAHPGTDVTLIASAHAPSGQPVPALDVGVAVGDLRRTLRVTGDRRFRRGLFGLRPTAPEPFVTMPITWERAYGGRDGAETCLHNPIGRGFALRADRLDGALLPNVEDPAHLIQGPEDRPAPAGLGPVPSGWSPRRELAGTFDDRWQKERAPIWPADFDPQFYRSAPLGLWSERPLVGGEQVTFLNLGPEPVTSFRLPRVEVVIHTWIARERLRQRVRLDRVIFEPDREALVLVWRSSLDCGADARRVVRSVVSTKEVLP